MAHRKRESRPHQQCEPVGCRRRKMPNSFAYLMLSLWPLAVIVMFRVMTTERAMIWSILGGYLILPPAIGIYLPVLPGFDKHSIPALSALVCIVALGRRVSPLPAGLIGKVLLVVFIVSPIGTVLTNREPVFFALGALPGLTLRDIFSAGIYQFMTILPFVLARDLLATPTAQRELVRALVIAGLAYSLPMLFEVRMSPQLNLMIYGYFQHSFDQMIRFGGFRPIVFLQHGLWLAIFTLMTLAAAVAAARHAIPAARMRYVAASIYLAVMLILCRSAGPLILALGLLPLLMFAGQKMQLRIAAVLAVLVVAYPMLRGAALIPVDAMVQRAETIDHDRAGSLRFRFDNEASLLAHAARKPAFGWGQWDRNMVHHPETGQPISVSDGRWIIVLGIGGWAAFLAEFGLLALPLVTLWRRSGWLPARDAPFVSPLALMLAVNMVDLIPNATLVPITWLVAGALLGFAERPVTASVQERARSGLAGGRRLEIIR